MAEEFITLIVENLTVKKHTYYNYKVCVALDNRFDCIINDVSYKNCKAIIIAPGTSQQFDGHNSTLLLNSITTGSFLAQRAKKTLQGKPCVLPDETVFKDIITEFNSAGQGHYSKKALAEKNNLVMAQLFPEKGFDHVLPDTRMLTAISYIEKNLEERVKLEDLAKHLFLSSEHIRHLFSRHLHISFIQYVLWKKARAIFYYSLTSNTTLANECLRFGFTDQSHFTKIFLKMFGATPATYLKHCTIIQ